MTSFEDIARNAARIRRERILLIPDAVKVDEQHLHSMTNDEFVAAFKALQRLVIRIYESIEEAPFDWGYPEQNDSRDINTLAYKRLMALFYALMSNGSHQSNQVLIDMKKFKKTIKAFKDIDKMIDGLSQFGFVFDDYSRKSELFSVTYPENTALLKVLFIYWNLPNRDQNMLLIVNDSFERLSYRWIEDPQTQTHEMLFHDAMDECSSALLQIQEWLHEEAASYGYIMDITHPYEKGCIAYKKGSKTFLLVGEREIDGVATIFSKVIFRNVFITEQAKMLDLYQKFPETFTSNCTCCRGSKPADGTCTMRICYDIDGKPHRNCAYISFFFLNPTIDDIKSILQLFIIENKIKRPDR